MRKINGYDEAKPYEESEKLPVGGYVIQILGTEEINHDWGCQLLITFDIAEGDYRSFYTDQFKNSQLEDKKYKGTYRIYLPKEDGSEQDNWTIRRLKTDITAVETSNPGFHWDWDEKKLVNKKVGAVFFEKEYEFNGRRGFFTTLHSFRDIEKIRSGDYKIPKPKMLNKSDADNAYATSSSFGDFTDLGDDDSDLPF